MILSQSGHISRPQINRVRNSMYQNNDVSLVTGRPEARVDATNINVLVFV
jgi:hypothetical protein